jgi:uncharacterized protein YbjT (DUF2867 family)
MPTTVLVTGATGTVGSEVVRHLAGVPDVIVHAGMQEPSLASGVLPGVRVVPFDFTSESVIHAACRGVDRLFLLTPTHPRQVEFGRTAIHAARNAGVQHIVRLSAAGADQEPGIQLARWHRAVEQAIEDSVVPWTFLRPNNLMSNFINFYPPDATGSIYLPWGTGACSWVDAADVGAVAATVLRGTGHAHATYTLTGPAALTIRDVASALSAATGRTIRYVDVPEDTARRTMLEFRVPEWLVDALMELHAVDKLGRKAAVTTIIQDVLGRPPRSFADFARNHREHWARSSSETQGRA